MKDVAGCEARGRCRATVNPGISEWGNPAELGNQIPSSMAECIGHLKLTQGTETSKYLQERKSTETPLVAASESGYSPNREACFPGLRTLIRSYKGIASKILWNVEP